LGATVRKTSAPCAQPGKPRPRNAEATRAALLSAARARFASDSYENVGVREIAADVGVNAALVSRYFGSKEELFAELITRPEKADPIFGGTLEELPQRVADRMFDREDEDSSVEDLLIMLRSISSPTAAEVVRSALKRLCEDPVIGRLDGDKKELRARMLCSLIIGLGFSRMMWDGLAHGKGERADAERRIRELVETCIANI